MYSLLRFVEPSSLFNIFQFVNSSSSDSLTLCKFTNMILIKQEGKEMKNKICSLFSCLIPCCCELLCVITLHPLLCMNTCTFSRRLFSLRFFFYFVIPLALPSVYSIFTSKACVEQMSFQMSVFCLIALN